MDTSTAAKKISVLIPCLNEEHAIANVVKDFKKILPEASIYVYDNNSTDKTAEVARASGAEVSFVRRRGKGNVIQEMFRDVESDIYILVDGDNTYSAEDVHMLYEAMQSQQADMVVGSRIKNYHGSQSRIGHHFGNIGITSSINYLFRTEFKDVLSGYRIFSRRFVKSAPIFVQGFEIETLLTIHAVEVGAKTLEVDIQYGGRPEGSESKLNTLRDGLRIMWTIFKMFKDHRPLLVYSLLTLFFWTFGLLVGVPVVIEFFNTGLVPRFPSAILAGSLITLGFLSLFSGVILSTLARTRREIKKLAFLSIR